MPDQYLAKPLKPASREIPLVKKNQDFDCEYLPAYAQFLLKNKVEEYTVAQLGLFRDLKVPLFKYFESLSEEELISNGKGYTTDLLQYFAENNAAKFVSDSLNLWLTNQLPIISRDQIVPEDISQISFIRRKLLRDFLPSYTSDPVMMVKIMEEVDRIMVQLDSVCLKHLFQLNQDLYKQAQSISQIGNWSWDIKSDKLSWSDEVYRIYELEPQSLIREKLALYNHPDDAAIVKTEIETARKNKSSFDFYYRINLPSGRQKVIHAKGNVELDEKGEVQTLLGTVQDETKQKAVEAELKSNQSLLKKVADLAPTIISAYNVNTGEYVFVNEGFKNLLGHDPDEIMKNGISSFISIIHPDDLLALTEKNQLLLGEANRKANSKEEIIGEFKYRLRHKNGKYHWFHTFETVFSRNSAGKVVEVLNISLDITKEVNSTLELQNKNEQIVKNEERFHKMTEAVEDYAILLLSKDGIVENWNKGAEKIKGYSPDEIIGKSFRVFYPKEDQQSGLPEKLIEIARKEGKAFHEGWRIRKNGESFWGNTVITALHDNNGELFGFSKVTRDLTSKKLAEQMLERYTENLQEKNKELEQINQELESFTYVASHDLQEPLRKIKTFTNFIIAKEKDNLADTTRDYFERIISATNRMTNLIDALLQFSKIGATPVMFEPTDLNVILEEAKKDISDIIDEKKAVVEANGLPSMKVIPLQFHQLFVNILSNSLKYSNKDVPLRITITASLEPAKGILQGHANEYCHRISFSDNGIGFEQQYADKIFELFQRLHGKSEYTGTGIGLAICKKIVQHHGGVIKAQGIPGIGARFDIYLPL
ncbi:MAG: hypothetical protein C5B52_04435 [Bacteroidetes bacterium]|nr:MAG: hypothetical protein C5B52_04435 [Bacteroidota bacterium]